MAITEATRHHLHQRLDSVLGSEGATTLMEHLPPTGWDGVATKTDLARLGTESSAEIRQVGSDLRLELRDLELRLERTLRTSLYANLGAMGAFAAAVIAAVKL